MFRNKKFRNLGPQVDIIPIVDISKTKKHLSKMQSASDMLRMPNIKFMTPPYDPQLMVRVKEVNYFLWLCYTMSRRHISQKLTNIYVKQKLVALTLPLLLFTAVLTKYNFIS